jgi:hypothetical protein
MLFALDFDRTSKTSLAICANAVRLIGSSVVPERELPHLTGCSPETINVGWQLKPYIKAIANVQRGRGKVLRLTPLGLKAAHGYPRHVAASEERWADEYGPHYCPPPIRLAGDVRAICQRCGAADRSADPAARNGTGRRTRPSSWSPRYRRRRAATRSRVGRSDRSLLARSQHATALSAVGYEPGIRTIESQLPAQVPGPRPFPVRLINAYIGRVQKAAVDDPVVAAAFVKVMHLLALPPILMAPALIWRVPRHRQSRPAVGASTASAVPA